MTRKTSAILTIVVSIDRNEALNLNNLTLSLSLPLYSSKRSPNSSLITSLLIQSMWDLDSEKKLEKPFEPNCDTLFRTSRKTVQDIKTINMKNWNQHQKTKFVIKKNPSSSLIFFLQCNFTSAISSNDSYTSFANHPFILTLLITLSL